MANANAASPNWGSYFSTFAIKNITSSSHNAWDYITAAIQTTNEFYCITPSSSLFGAENNYISILVVLYYPPPPVTVVRNRTRSNLQERSASWQEWGVSQEA